MKTIYSNDTHISRPQFSAAVESLINEGMTVTLWGEEGGIGRCSVLKGVNQLVRTAFDLELFKITTDQGHSLTFIGDVGCVEILSYPKDSEAMALRFS